MKYSPIEEDRDILTAAVCGFLMCCFSYVWSFAIVDCPNWQLLALMMLAMEFFVIFSFCEKWELSHKFAAAGVSVSIVSLFFITVEVALSVFSGLFLFIAIMRIIEIATTKGKYHV